MGEALTVQARRSLRDLDRVATTCPRHAARKKRKAVDRDVASRVLKLRCGELTAGPSETASGNSVSAAGVGGFWSPASHVWVDDVAIEW